MTYDRDIKWARRLLDCLAVGNLWALMLNLWGHNWFIAIACGIWFTNVFTMLDLTKVQQVTRDRCRLMESGLYAMRDENDAGRD
jgi:hypothetical protein